MIVGDTTDSVDSAISAFSLLGRGSRVVEGEEGEKGIGSVGACMDVTAKESNAETRRTDRFFLSLMSHFKEMLLSRLK